MTTMGLNVATFDLLLHCGFKLTWDSTPIPQHDAPGSAGELRLGACSLDAAGALGLVLHLLNSTMCKISLQQIFAIIPSTVT